MSKKGFPKKKLLIILLVIVLGATIIFGLLYWQGQKKIADLNQAQQELQQVMLQSQTLVQEVAQQGDQGNLEVALSKTDEALALFDQALQINQKLIDNIRGENQTVLLRRQEIIKLSKSMLEKLAECVKLADDQTSPQFKTCQQEYATIAQEVQQKTQEFAELTGQTIPQ